MRVVSRLTWAFDLTPQYATMKAIGSAAAGATILDVPCGGGVAFRALGPGQDVRYIAGDLIGSTLLSEGSRRQRTLFAAGQQLGHAIPPSASNLHQWLDAAGIVGTAIEPTRGFGVFRGTKS
jgi:hypothetical protein